MSAATATQNPVERQNAGLQTLNPAVWEPDKTQTFRGRGDFTKERHERPEPSNEEIFAGILRLQKENADFIAAKNEAWEKESATALKAGCLKG